MKRATPILVLFILLSPAAFFLMSLNPARAADPGVYILQDGSLQGRAVQGTSNIIRNGDTYTLIGDIEVPLYVQKDNIVIDGSGHTVTGANGRGIDLSQRQCVTVKDTRITLGTGTIIKLDEATDCLLIGNTLVGDRALQTYCISFLYSQRIAAKNNTITGFFKGISMASSSNNTITGNTITDGVIGIDIEDTTGCLFRNNNLSNCSFSLQTFRSPECENDLDVSNTVNGKPIYYWINARNQTVPSEAAYIVLIKCNNIIVENSNLQGINLVLTTGSIISDVKMVDRGNNIHLLDCSNIRIVNSVLHDRGVGIRIINSLNTTISGNDISHQITTGIDLINATNTTILGNTLTNNGYAIGHSQVLSVGTVLASNNFTNNGCAVKSTFGEMKILGNNFEDNGQGIKFSDNSGNVVTQNNFTQNKDALYFIGSSGNSIYLNNFFENERQVTDAGVNNSLTQTTQAASNPISSMQLIVSHFDDVNFIPPPPPSINQYDNGAKGNYWIGYNGSDKNGNGIGDIAYQLYENNQDNYPLIVPINNFTMSTNPNSSSEPDISPSEPPPQQPTLKPTETVSSAPIADPSSAPLWLLILLTAVICVGVIALELMKLAKRK